MAPLQDLHRLQVIVAEHQPATAALVLHADLATLDRADRHAVRAAHAQDSRLVRLDIVELRPALRPVAHLEVILAVHAVVIAEVFAAVDALAGGLHAARSPQEALAEGARNPDLDH